MLSISVRNKRQHEQGGRKCVIHCPAIPLAVANIPPKFAPPCISRWPLALRSRIVLVRQAQRSAAQTGEIKMIAASTIIRDAFRYTSTRRAYNATLAAVMRNRCDIEHIDREERTVKFVFDVYGRHAIVTLTDAPVETL